MVTFIETIIFSRLVKNYLSDDDYNLLQQELVQNPQSGAVIRGSGGLRKIRWFAAGRGKRGGYRIIYFLRLASEEIWLLTIYPKNAKDSFPSHVLKKIRQEIEK